MGGISPQILVWGPFTRADEEYFAPEYWVLLAKLVLFCELKETTYHLYFFPLHEPYPQRHERCDVHWCCAVYCHGAGLDCHCGRRSVSLCFLGTAPWFCSVVTLPPSPWFSGSMATIHCNHWLPSFLFGRVKVQIFRSQHGSFGAPENLGSSDSWLFKSQGVLFVSFCCNRECSSTLLLGFKTTPLFSVGFFKIFSAYQLLKCRFLALKVEFCDYCHHLCSGGNAPWCGGKGFRCECPGRCELSHSAAPPAAMVREKGQEQPVGGFKWIVVFERIHLFKQFPFPTYQKILGISRCVRISSIYAPWPKLCCSDLLLVKIEK